MISQLDCQLEAHTARLSRKAPRVRCAVEAGQAKRLTRHSTKEIFFSAGGAARVGPGRIDVRYEEKRGTVIESRTQGVYPLSWLVLTGWWEAGGEPASQSSTSQTATLQSRQADRTTTRAPVNQTQAQVSLVLPRASSLFVFWTGWTVHAARGGASLGRRGVQPCFPPAGSEQACAPVQK